MLSSSSSLYSFSYELVIDIGISILKTGFCEFPFIFVCNRLCHACVSILVSSLVILFVISSVLIVEFDTSILLLDISIVSSLFGTSVVLFTDISIALLFLYSRISYLQTGHLTFILNQLLMASSRNVCPQ